MQGGDDGCFSEEVVVMMVVTGLLTRFDDEPPGRA